MGRVVVKLHVENFCYVIMIMELLSERGKEAVNMPVLDYIEVQNRKIAIDREGYLVNTDDWNEPIANALAERENVGQITDDKLAILKFIRWYYKEYNFFPMLSSVCKSVSKPKDCLREEFYNPLIAWKLAGLPHPEEPLFSLLKAGQSPG